MLSVVPSPLMSVPFLIAAVLPLSAVAPVNAVVPPLLSIVPAMVLPPAPFRFTFKGFMPPAMLAPACMLMVPAVFKVSVRVPPVLRL